MGTFYPNSGVMHKAANLRTSLAGGKMHLYKDGFNPSLSTTKAELDLEECDFSGYPAGGMPVTNWLNPILDPSGGALIESGTLQFECSGVAPLTGNLVGGWYYTTTGGHLLVGTFPVSVPMEGPGQGIPLNVKLIEGTGQ